MATETPQTNGGATLSGGAEKKSYFGAVVAIYTGAMWMPKHELRPVDLMVHKSEGIPALLSALETFLPFRRVHASERASGRRSYSNLKRE